ncbi:MAG: ammonia-forming cytochrome c nitrite reductase subunit c552 [Planctomycetia bacterium]|nr:MAG: ammonia-forming cytochrome c nitrite reductase subunit c552 [Planctomycetia bacterium]
MSQRNSPSSAGSQPQPAPGRPLLTATVVAVVAALGTFGLTALLVNIFQHKQEARHPFFRVVELTDDIDDPAVWGKNFPLQYDGYKRTSDMVRTRYGGSEAMPRTPTQADPRSVVAQSRLEEDPRLRKIWAGYAFATDFREERGHAYMLTDQLYTERQQVVKQPGACLNCHASMVTAYRKAGDGDMFRGFEVICRTPYAEARPLVEHPVTCIDCHDPGTMALRVTRPAFIEGMRAYKASQGVKDYDVNTMATRHEMRSFVCGQCHVEYHFAGEGKRLTYPWHNGLKADEILAWYDQSGFKDWVHADSGAPMLKAQHPEFELWNQGVHARAGVSCADCHMPYQRVGAMKISDHHIRSPLLNINAACQTCHKASESELLARAETIQGRTQSVRNLAMDAVVELIADIVAARDGGATDAQLGVARDFHRKAQFLLDFIEAENSSGFHADQEAVRVLSLSLDYARRGQRALRGLPTGATAATE